MLLMRAYESDQLEDTKLTKSESLIKMTSRLHVIGSLHLHQHYICSWRDESRGQGLRSLALVIM